MLQEGRKAPFFSLPSDSGEEISLASLKGKKVVLYFYPKDMTPGCTREACDFRDQLAGLAQKGAVVLGVSADSVDTHARFKAKHGLNFPLLSDVSHKMLKQYGVWREKRMYGRKFMGIVRTTVILDEEGRVVRIFPNVKVKDHVREILQTL